MKHPRHLDDAEPAGEWVDNHGHMEWRHLPPPPPELSPRSEARDIVELRRRRDGWTALRQRTFLASLANTGSVVHAAESADITPRSAYRLRNHPKGAAFREAWDAALMTASYRLLGVAFERALNGTPRTIWKGNSIAYETQVPSDKLLMYLLRHLHPALFAEQADTGTRAAAIAARAAAYPAAMAALADTEVEADELDIDDYRPQPLPEHWP